MEKIKCPKCGEVISIDDVLTQQVENRIKTEFQKKNQEIEKEIAKKEQLLQKEKEYINKEKKSIEQNAQKLVNEKLEKERRTIKNKLIMEVQKDFELEKESLKEQLENKNRRLMEANKRELELRMEKNRLKEEKENFELEKQRQLDIEREKIIENAQKKASEESKYKIAQLEKKVSDATKAKDELARKLEQGSQQTQGEVLELELEEMLASQFIYDKIKPVPKGMSGADIIQIVKNNIGDNCGKIIWELKKTKTWNKNWIQKLKNDQRTEKADIAVIVSYTLPEDVKGFVYKNGVWICDISLVIALATALRLNLESVSYERRMLNGKNEKMDILYNYVTGIEFKQRVEAIIESFSNMSDSLKKERIAYEKIWSEREKQIQIVLKNTVGIYGDLSGVVQLQKIEALELSNK